MRTLLRDLSYALRQLRKSPAFTLVGVATLALGIGANTAIFTLVHAILLQPLPVKNPSQLYRLGSKEVNCCVIGGLQDVWDIYSNSLYHHIREQTPEFEELAAFQAGSPHVSARRNGDNSPARSLHAEYVTGNYFSLLGISAATGRLMGPSDDRPGATPSVVMSHRTWQNYYASDPSIVGSTFVIYGFQFTVVGIASPGFFGDRLTDTPPDFWIPLAMEPAVSGQTSRLNSADVHWLYVMGRLRSGVSPAQVQSKVSAELQQWLNSDEGSSTVGQRGPNEISKQKTLLIPAGGGVATLANATEMGLRLLMVVSGLVLLIACANIANLLLARSTAHKMQTSIRLALGAGRSRLIRQVLTESVLLAILGGMAGVFVAYTGTTSILAIAFRGSPQLPVSPDPSLPVLAFSLLLSILTGLIFGAAPAWINSHAEPAEALRGAGRSTVHGATLAQKSLVILQAALSLVLVAGAILLVESLRKLEHQNLGFHSDHRYIVNVGRVFQGYSPEKLAGAYRELEQRMSSIPGMITASYSMYSPLGGDNWSSSVYFTGRAHSTGQHGDYASWLRIGPNYFPTIGTRLLRGRTIGEQDTPTSAHVAVVNETFARKFFNEKDPIGKRFGMSDPKHTSDFEIVGVVEDAKYQDTRGPAYSTVFLPYLQRVDFTQPSEISDEESSQKIATIELKVSSAPENLENTVRRTLAELDPDMTVLRMTTFDEQVSENFNEERLLARLTTLFGILALTLAAVGLYGVTAYTVEQRTREIGVRVAVGADRSAVLVMVLRGALRQIALGLAIGLPLALIAGRLISSQLFEVKGYDPLALGLATVLLAACAVIASLVPARHAASIDPVEALRSE